MRRAVRAEWLKVWSDPGTAWLLGALVALSVAVSAVVISAAHCPAAGCGQDPARLSFAGVYLGQAVAALGGVLAIGNEYGTGMIRVTLTAMPRRISVLAAKALVLAGLVLAASALAVGVSMLAGSLILPGHGFTSARGFDLVGVGAWQASFRTALYLTLVAVISLGVTAVVRESAAAIGTALGLLYLFPIAASLVGDQAIQRRLAQIGPLPAGLDAQASTGLRGLPLTPWQGLGVAALWAAGALVLGGLVLCRRDA
ncbi:MAG TPA: ABC transporter permease [Trebonia sp.]